MDERIIVSMTSYPKRINNVAKSIYYILNEQTRTPDEIHLWLCEEEFPNKEYDLPQDLVYIKNNSSKVFLHWVDNNTYCHKRHEYFKIGKNGDCVFLIDDDVYYNSHLIEYCMLVHNKYPNCIVSYNIYSQHVYKGFKIIYDDPILNLNFPRFDTRFCGQSMIPYDLYPKDVLLDYNQEIRDKICPVCDETYLNPFIVRDNIPIYHLNLGWGVDIDSSISHNDGLCVYTHVKESNGYERRDNWLKQVLNHYPDILEIYKSKYKYGE